MTLIREIALWFGVALVLMIGSLRAQRKLDELAALAETARMLEGDDA